MAQAHLDPLSAADAAILAQERGATHMHVGALARFSGARRTSTGCSTTSAAG